MRVLGEWDFLGFFSYTSVRLVSSVTIFVLPLVLCSSVDEGSRNEQI